MSKKPKNIKKKIAKPLIGTALVSLSCLSIESLKEVIASTATLPISVRLLRAVEITLNTSMDFGTLAMTLDRGGTARIDPNLNRLIIDDNSSLALAGGVPRVGRFTVRGTPYPISVSVEDTSVRLTNGLQTLTVNNFNILTNDAGAQVTITPQAGENTFTVPIGATLNTKSGQLDGTYVGTTRIFANFQ